MAETRQQRLEREQREKLARRNAAPPSTGGSDAQGNPLTRGAIPDQTLARQAYLERAPKMLRADELRNRPLYQGRKTSFNGQLLTDEQVANVAPYKSATNMSNFKFGQDGVGKSSIRTSPNNEFPPTGKMLFNGGDSRTIPDGLQRGSGHMRDLPPPPPMPQDLVGPPNPGPRSMTQLQFKGGVPIQADRGYVSDLRRQGIPLQDTPKPSVPAFEGTNTDPMTGMVKPSIPPVSSDLAGYDGEADPNVYKPNQPMTDLVRPSIPPVSSDLAGYNGEADPNVYKPNQPFTVPAGADNVTINTEGFNSQQDAYEAYIKGNNPPLSAEPASVDQPWDRDIQFSPDGSLLGTGQVADPGGTTTTDVVRWPPRQAEIANDLVRRPGVQTAIKTMQGLAHPDQVIEQFGNEHIPPTIPPTEEQMWDDRETGGRSADERRRNQLLEGAGGAMTAAAAGGGATGGPAIPEWQRKQIEQRLKEQRANTGRGTASVDPVEPGDNRGNQRGGASASEPKVAGQDGSTPPENKGTKTSKGKWEPKTWKGKSANWLWKGGKWVAKKAPAVGAAIGAVESVVNNDQNQEDQLEYIDRYGGLAPNVSNSQEYPDILSGAASGAVNMFDLIPGVNAIPDDVVNFGTLARKTGSAVRNVFTTNDRNDLGFGGSPRATAFKEGVDNYVNKIVPPNATSRERQKLLEKTEYRAARLQNLLQEDYKAESKGLDGTFNYDALSKEDKELFTAMGGKVPGLERDSGSSQRLSPQDRELDKRDAIADEWEAMTPEQQQQAIAEDKVNRLEREPLDQGTPVSNKPSSDTGQFYRRVGADGTVEFTTDSNQAAQGGYTKVDLPASAQPSKIAAQNGIEKFPGNSFLKDVNQDLRRRSRIARGQRGQATANQRTLFDRAAKAVDRMDIKGLTENGRADMISEFAQIMQSGRDAFAPNDLNTTKEMVDADRNRIYDEGNAVDLDRNDIYAQKNYIDAQTKGTENSLKRREQIDTELDNVMEVFGDRFDSEGKTIEDRKAYRTGAKNFIKSSGILDYIEQNNVSRQQSSQLMLDGAIGFQLTKWMQEGGVPMDRATWQINPEGETPLRQIVNKIQENDPSIGVQLSGRDFYDMISNPMKYIDINSTPSDKTILRMGKKKVTLAELLALGEGAGAGTYASTLYRPQQ